MQYCVENYLPYTLHMIKTSKFKTVSVKVIFSSTVKKEEITEKNFLADILTYSTKKYKTHKEMTIALQDLYAMNIFSNCYRIGNFYNMDIRHTLQRTLLKMVILPLLFYLIFQSIILVSYIINK